MKLPLPTHRLLLPKFRRSRNTPRYYNHDRLVQGLRNRIPREAFLTLAGELKAEAQNV